MQIFALFAMSDIKHIALFFIKNSENPQLTIF